ncbi:unnamed protein product [Gongylonema pulchrum]|uniref:Secreted protein n=1 Tax=Gongylonema pulchrum TaxID=637853 RepID=A0A183DYY5_9BILA|nr:unnamed protein product [Gongylonema pulchrum]
MTPRPQLSLIPFALRTSGCNGTTDQGSDSAPVQTIAFTVIDFRYNNGACSEVAVEELDVSSLGLQAALQKVRFMHLCINHVGLRPQVCTYARRK